MERAKTILNFWHLMEKPKLIFRSIKLSSGRKESVADHSWRLAVIAAILTPYLSKKIDSEKTLKMALFHDVGEMEEGDIPSYDHFFDENLKKRKDESEKKVMTDIKNRYSGFGNELYEIWDEYEKQKTFESKFIKALDKLDARVQMIDDPETANFSQEKIEKGKELTALTEMLCEIDPILIELNKLSKQEKKERCGF